MYIDSKPTTPPYIPIDLWPSIFDRKPDGLWPKIGKEECKKLQKLFDEKKAAKIASIESKINYDFKDIPGYEMLYGVSKSGDIVSYGNKSNHSNSIILKPSEDKDGYLRVTLQKDKVRSYFRVSRLVAFVYLPNPLNLPFVNHINEDIKNNNVSNLEWTDEYGNWLHSNPNGEVKVVQLSLSGDFISEYKSLMEASRCTGINQGNITNCIAGRCKSIGGFKWEKK